MLRTLFCFVALAALLALPGCKACPDDAELPDYGADTMEPTCGPISGGTVVTITGSRLGTIQSIWLEGSTSTSYVERTDVTVVDEDTGAEVAGISFTMPEQEWALPVLVKALIEFQIKLDSGKYRWCTRIVDLGSFQYIDVPAPELHDADTGVWGDNPLPSSGNCGGYYWARIDGAGFSGGEISVTWKDDLLEGPEEVEVVDDSTLNVRVPPGAEGTWVLNIQVWKVPEECDTVLTHENKGAFEYVQGDCNPMGAYGSLVDAPEGPHFLDVGDVIADASGHRDVALATSAAGFATLSVYRGNGEGLLVSDHASLLSSGTPTAVHLADLDDNDYDDVAVAIAGSNVLDVFLNAGAGYSLKSATFSFGGAPTDVVSGDFDGDGDVDLAVSVAGSNTVALLERTSPGTLDATSWGALPAGGEPRALAVGDFDGSGGDDLVAAAGDELVLWTSSGTSSAPLAELDRESLSGGASGQAVLDVGAGSFTGGARDDVVAISTFEAESLRVFSTDPSSGLALDGSHALGSALGSLPTLLEVCDLDGADLADVVVVRDDGRLEALRFVSAGTAPVYVEPADIPTIAVSDLAAGLLASEDAATFDDLAIGLGTDSKGSGFPQFAVWLNDGDGCW